LTKAIELDDDEAGLYFERALVYDTMSETESAIEDYSRAIELNPNYVIARFRRGLIYRDEDELELALDDFLAAIAGDPAIFVYYDQAAQIYGLLGEDDAEEFYTQIATGLGRFSSGEFDDAAERFDQALKVNTDSVDETARAYVYYNRGRVYRFTGENAAATEDYEAALELIPELGEAYFEQHFMAQDAGDDEVSQEMLDLAIENDPAYASPYLSRAVAYELDGEFETATPDFWGWIRLNQMREIDWTDRFAPGEPLIVEMGFGFVHRIPFSGSAGQPVSAEAQMIEVGSAVVDTLLVIMDEDGNPVMANDDGGEGFNSAIANFVLPEDGDYTLIVSHAGAGNSGPVEVNVKLSPVVATPTAMPVPDVAD
jgi:Tfp pilus assembly protein PilF